MYISCPSSSIAVTERSFCWALEFVETSALVLCIVPDIWLKILGMFNLPMLQLSEGLFLLICMLESF